VAVTVPIGIMTYVVMSRRQNPAAVATAVAKVLASGEESAPTLPVPAPIICPLLNTEAAQLYGSSCFCYNGVSGGAHAGCETHHFTPSSAPVFICDNAPKTGNFDA
jgi:hypothetical protein